MQGTVWKRTWTWRGVEKQAWVLDWRERGRRKRRQFTTRQEANLALAALLRRRRSETYDEIMEITFKDFYPIYDRMKRWKSESWRERVRISCEVSLARFHDVALSDITPKMVEDFVRDRLKVVKAWTVRNELSALSDLCRWGIRLRHLAENPVAHVERPPVSVKQDNPAPYLPPGDLDKLLGAAGKDRPLYLFAAATGLRVSELLALHWDDVREGFVTVRNGKGSKQRIVPLIPQALQALQEVPRRLKDPRVFWWIGSRYDALKRFKRRVKWAGLGKPYTFHHLRHTYASYALMAGVDLNVISQNLGHSSAAVTRRYAYLSPSYQRQEIQKLGRSWKVGATLAQRRAKLSKSGRS